MVDVIVRQFQPARIFLFGSCASGSDTVNSDVDLLVVMTAPNSKRQQAFEIRKALRGIRVPKDIVVTTPEEFAWRKDVPGTIEYPAVHEGDVLYEKC